MKRALTLDSKQFRRGMYARAGSNRSFRSTSGMSGGGAGAARTSRRSKHTVFHTVDDYAAGAVPHKFSLPGVNSPKHSASEGDLLTFQNESVTSQGWFTSLRRPSGNCVGYEAHPRATCWKQTPHVRC